MNAIAKNQINLWIIFYAWKGHPWGHERTSHWQWEASCLIRGVTDTFAQVPGASEEQSYVLFFYRITFWNDEPNVLLKWEKNEKIKGRDNVGKEKSVPSKWIKIEGKWIKKYLGSQNFILYSRYSFPIPLNK